MAEAFLRFYGGDKYEAYSAGMEPKGINPLTRQVMSEIGVDISGQESKGLKIYLGHVSFGYAITVCNEAEEKCPRIFPGAGQRLHWDIEDPAKFTGTEEEKLKKFREIRDLLKQKVQDWLKNQNLSSVNP